MSEHWGNNKSTDGQFPKTSGSGITIDHSCDPASDGLGPTVPLQIDDTDYLNLFWSGKDSLHLSRTLGGAHDSEVSPGVNEHLISEMINEGQQRTPQDINTKGTAKKLRKKVLERKSGGASGISLHNDPARKGPPPIQPRLLPALLPKKPPPQARKLTLEEMQQRVEQLSRPYADKTEEITPPPPLCTEGPQLSFSCVDKLQEHTEPGTFEFEFLPESVHSLRMEVTALTGDAEEWETNTRSAFQDLFTSRKDFFSPIDNMSSAERDEMVRSAMFAKLDYRKTPRHIMEYNGFMHRYCLGFMCLVFDLRMQLIGTYDLQYGNFLPGVNVCPAGIRRPTADMAKKAASLLQIDILSLPRNAFAIVPVLFDQAGHILPDFGLHCRLLAAGHPNELYAKAEGRGEWAPVSERMGAFVGIRTSAEQANSNQISKHIPENVGFVAEFGKSCGYSPFVLFRRSSSDKGWAVKSLNLPIRGSKTSDIIVAITQGLAAACVLPYHLFYIEHCSDCDHHAMTTWHVPGSYEKRCAEVRRAIRGYVPSAFVYSNKLHRPPRDEHHTRDGMARIGAFEITVRPYFSEYSMQLYSKLCRKLLPQPSDVTDICSSLLLPDRLQYTKKRSVRVDLFDSYYKKLTSDVRVILFKVNTYHHTTDEALESLTDIKELHTYMNTNSSVGGDGCGTNTSAASEEDTGILELTNPPPRSVILSGRNRPSSAGSPTRRQSMQSKSPLPTSGSGGRRGGSPIHEGHGNGRGLPPKKYAAGEEKKDSFAEEIMKSEAVQDSVFRHSLSFYRVRCWSLQEVDQWFKSHGVSATAITNAHVSGVEDGASLLALANKITLRKWGIRGQLTLRKLELSLASIRSGGDMYDPCIVEGLPEDGQDKRGYSRASTAYLSKKTSKSPGGQNFEQFAVSTASGDGSVRFDISHAGAYVFVATSPSNATYCSHAFTCGVSSKYVYSALLKPITAPVYFRVLMEEEGSDVLDGVPFCKGGLLLSVVNMTSGKRHTAFAGFENVFEEDVVDTTTDNTAVTPSSATPFAATTDEGEQDEGVEAEIDATTATKGPATSPDASPILSPTAAPKKVMMAPELQRFNSIVNILSVSPTAPTPELPRSLSTGAITSGGGSVRPFSSSERRKKKLDVKVKKTVVRVIACVLWLPVGQYYSEVDGSVFRVEDKDHLRFIRETPPGDFIGAVPELAQAPINDRLIFGGEFAEALVVKGHKRLIKRSIRGFQMIYRRYKKTFLFDKMCAYMVMRQGAKKFCEWAREEVRKKKVVKLQSWLRMTRESRNYRTCWTSTVFIQARLRVLLARLRLKRLKRSQMVLYEAIVRWHSRRQKKRVCAAIKIQSASRRRAAINKKDCLIFAKRCKRLFVRYIDRIKAKIRMANVVKLARRREEGERMDMAAEEAHWELHVVWMKAEQRRLIELRLQDIARRKHIAASRIQAICRGLMVRHTLDRGKRAVGKLQRMFRIGVYIKRRNMGQKMRYLVGFKMLLQHPQLLGGTMLLMGMRWDSSHHYYYRYTNSNNSEYGGDSRRFIPQCSDNDDVANHDDVVEGQDVDIGEVIADDREGEDITGFNTQIGTDASATNTTTIDTGTALPRERSGVDQDTPEPLSPALDPATPNHTFASSSPERSRKSSPSKGTTNKSSPSKAKSKKTIVSTQHNVSPVVAYAGYLTRPTIKIQSVLRMARRRMWYISSRIRVRGIAPPLFRFHIAVPSSLISGTPFQPPATEDMNHQGVESECTSGDMNAAAKAQAAIKLQAVARRFSVQLHLPSLANAAAGGNGGSLITNCDPQSVHKDESAHQLNLLQQHQEEGAEEGGSTPVSADGADVAGVDEDFFPGYYDDAGRYLYYQADESGDYFGYYDDEGTYQYCDGDKSKVSFHAEVIPTAPAKTATVTAVSAAVVAVNESEDDDCISSRDQFQIDIADAQQQNIEKDIRQHEKSVKFIDQVNANTPADQNVIMDGLEVDAFVNDIDNYSDVPDEGGVSERNGHLKTAGKSSKLARPWSFMSDMTEDNHKTPSKGKGKGGNTATATPSSFPRIRSFASGITGATDMTGGRSLSESVKDAISATSKALSLKGSSLKHKAGLMSGELSNNINVVTQQMRTTAEKTRLEKERLLRIKNHKFQIEDAVLTVRGTAMPDIPRLNRQWFIGIFPHTTDVMGEEGEDNTEHIRNRERDQQEYEMRHGRNIGEATRSALLYPLAKESFEKLNFSLQLADLPRYVVVDVCLFVEADEGTSIRPDYLPSNVSVPTAEHRSVSKGMATKTWLPAFRGEFRIDEGAMFGPCGGKMKVLMRPNLSEAIYLSRAQARRLSALEGLTISVALQPVAVPSCEFLLSLGDKNSTPPPFHPGHIIDAVLLQKYTSSYTFHGAVVCAGSFQDRMLVSARHKGSPLGLLEFNKNGECIGRITNHLETLKTVINIVVGVKHIMLCTNGGLMGMIRPRKTTETWSSPMYVELHESTVVTGIAMHRAGIDFFFTVDKYCNIGVCIFENSRLLKTFMNKAFANATICSITACCNSLYLGQTDGVLLVLDVTDLINGDFKIGGVLKEKIIYCGEVFNNKTSINSLAVLATNAFFSLPTEDPPPGRKAKVSVAVSQSMKSSMKVKSDGFSGNNILNSAFYGVNEAEAATDASLEGHLVFLGGGDGDPRVRVMRVIRIVPSGIDAVELGRDDGKAEAYTTLQEVAILRGHTRAVTAIIVDAAGRFIITASKEDHMFLVWDAFTYTCEKLVDDVDIGSIHGGLNCLFICSFKPPYLTMYTVPQERRDGWESNTAVTNDGRPEIGMVRTNLWCTASVKGGVAIPSKSMVRATQYLGENGRSIVEMWQKYHNRALNDEYKGGSGNAVLSGTSVMSRDARSTKSMTATESQGALSGKPVSSSKNYIPLPLSSAVRPSADDVWGSNRDKSDDASAVSEDQWGERAPAAEDTDDNEEGGGNNSVDSNHSVDLDAEIKERVAKERRENPGAFDDDEYRSNGKRIINRRYLSNSNLEEGQGGLLSGGGGEENLYGEQFGENSFNYPDDTTISVVVNRDPFAGKISHKKRMAATAPGGLGGGRVAGIRPNRLKKYDSDGREVSLAQHRKAHFSDSDSGDDQNIVIVPTRKYTAARYGSDADPGQDSDDNYGKSDYSEQYPQEYYHYDTVVAPRKVKRGVVQDLKDVESSGSDSDY